MLYILNQKAVIDLQMRLYSTVQKSMCANLFCFDHMRSIPGIYSAVSCLAILTSLPVILINCIYCRNSKIYNNTLYDLVITCIPYNRFCFR